MSSRDLTSLLERENELATLEGLVKDAVTGEAGVGLVEGPAGIGKSRLLTEAQRLGAAAGMRVLRARAADMERRFGFGVVRQLFEPVVAEGGRPALVGAARAARSVFDPDGTGDGDADPSFAALHGLYWLTANLSAEEPLLLTVDDLHWCDRTSLRFLAYLVRRMEGLPVLVIASLRSRQTGLDAVLVGDIAGDPLTVEMRPGPLSEDSVAALVRERLGEEAAPGFWMGCHAATAGNPLLLEEVLRALAAQRVPPDAAHSHLVADLGPGAVSGAVLLRLGRLPAAAGRVADAAAVLGDGAAIDMVAALAGLTVDETVRAAGALVEAELLRPDVAAASYVHPLVGTAVYRALPSFERGTWHHRAAALLAAAGAPAEQVAAHLELAPPRGDPAVVDVLRSAARLAVRRGAAENAVSHLRRALAEPPGSDTRAALLVELGRAEALTDGHAAAAHLAEGYELLEDPLARATAARALARTLLFTGNPEEGASVARMAAGELAGGMEDVRRELEAFELLAVLFGGGHPEALRRLAEHRSPPTTPALGAKMLAAIAAQEWVYAGGPSDACSELSLAALAGGDLIAADNGLLPTCAITNLVLADRPEAMEAWEVARADAHQRGSLFALSSLELWYGFTLLRRGDLTDAETSLRSALTHLALWGYGPDQAQIYCDAFLSAVLRERGDLAAARQALARSGDTGGTDDGGRYWLDSHLALLLAEHRFDDALRVSDQYAERFDSLVPNPVDAPWRSHKARALHRLGRAAEARSLVEAELERARAWGAPGTVARSLRTLARVAPDDDVTHLREAVDLVDESPARLEAAKAFAALGGALRRRGRRSEAREPLRRAYRLAVACGATPIAENARAELYAAGARPPTAALTGVASLTTTERRVALLAARGAGNRDIAEELYIAPKTVETHLGSVYRKLGIHSRHDLQPALLTPKHSSPKAGSRGPAEGHP